GKILSNFLLLRYLKKIFYNSVAELRVTIKLIFQADENPKKMQHLSSKDTGIPTVFPNKFYLFLSSYR
ncbi:hypothetical protein, partial [Coprobacter fastidiosus]|uniref:hypothetical protein n=1 Tax=Coprobacter fastidiosus TaxID=1099853 RepID=UPI001E4E4AE0